MISLLASKGGYPYVYRAYGAVGSAFSPVGQADIVFGDMPWAAASVVTPPARPLASAGRRDGGGTKSECLGARHEFKTL